MRDHTRDYLAHAGGPEWIGVDLDKTLAHYDSWRGEDHIGDPIPAMVERVKAWLSAGIQVRIFTARIHERGAATRSRIQSWCLRHLGRELEVTCVKDRDMLELWDDRAVQVIPNSGMPVRAMADYRKAVTHFNTSAVAERLIERLESCGVDARADRRRLHALFTEVLKSEVRRVAE